MKTLKKIILVFVLFFIYAYVVSIDNIPETISIFKGEQIKISTLWGINIKRENSSIETSSNIEESNFQELGNETFTVSLFDKIQLKKIDVNVMEEVGVIPIGEVVGIKLYTNGVLVVGETAIENKQGEKIKPYENTEIEEGDSIIAVNNTIINNTDELIKIIEDSKGEKLEITYISNEEEKKCEITPVKNQEDKYKIGLWVRDSAGGVGTVTFYNEQTESFAGLGHAITDIDTGDIINTSSGQIVDANIISIVKGRKDEPGKIQGSIKQNSTIGNIYKNTKFGIYGIVKNANNLSIDYSKKMKVASRQEIKTGEATFLCGIDGEIKEYKLQIEKIFLNNSYDNKSMLVKVTDEELIQKTGGIVQGMSGSPIIQNGKFIGAITHVFVDNPEIGYAVFGDMMIKQISE